MRGPISNAIIKLNENGYISRLKNQWWKKERGGGTCIVCIIIIKPQFWNKLYLSLLSYLKIGGKYTVKLSFI